MGFVTTSPFSLIKPGPKLMEPGFAFSFGVFQSYYHENEIVQVSNMVAVIGTCATVRTSPRQQPRISANE